MFKVTMRCRRIGDEKLTTIGRLKESNKRLERDPYIVERLDPKLVLKYDRENIIICIVPPKGIYGGPISYLYEDVECNGRNIFKIAVTETREEAEEIKQMWYGIQKEFHEQDKKRIPENFYHLLPDFSCDIVIEEMDYVKIKYNQRKRMKKLGAGGVIATSVLEVFVDRKAYCRNPDNYKSPPKNYCKMFDFSENIDVEISGI